MPDRIPIEKKVLSENDRIAAGIRGELKRRRIFALNLVSSPGSGKTSLLEKTVAALHSELSIALVVGDVQTDNDAVRLMRAGARMVRPIITGGACHLDAAMVREAIGQLDLDGTELLLIENVGNLVCPSSYDLGEDMKVVVLSTTEGDDKPLKYPAMFRRSSVMIVNKIDLLGTSDFDIATMRDHALKINGDLTVFETSCRTGAGLEAWFGWLVEEVHRKKR
ncbi:MAG: hydrogenase nickel incorporation protein HypB [Candidatus Zixiibacteriota bacterium]|nr:MAG: hydrogenase nickel incorporation protein HypB [candidate division Zixibacteria bacterium]